MESWMISLLIAVLGVVSTYAVLRNRVTRLEEDHREHVLHDDKYHSREHDTHEMIHKDFAERLNKCFKELDYAKERVTVLERDTSFHLTMPKAEEKFVSKGELELHLRNIELKTDHTSKMVDSMVGKLDDLNRLLSTNIVKNLSGQG